MTLLRTGLIALATVALLGGCAFPTHDPWKLKAIRAESMILKSAGTEGTLPESRWPPVIASLDPEFVIVSPEGVDIVIKPYFDGGWGYFVPADNGWKPDPPGRFSDLGHGVYWYHPY